MASWQHWLVVIPARLGSTRLPEKPLKDLCGKPLVVRVYERLKSLKQAGAEVVVATDHQKVLNCCNQYKIPAVMTDPTHQSGTDRCNEVAQNYPQPWILNVQGDEPFVRVEDLHRLVSLMEGHSGVCMGTLIVPSNSEEDFANPSAVKCIPSVSGQALYFSRAPVPASRASVKGPLFWRHLGIYGFSREGIEAFCRLPQSPMEQREALEQLRALENGIPIYLSMAQHTSLGIDTEEDLENARAQFDQNWHD